MKEWIVKDTLNNKYVQELVRCKDCKYFPSAPQHEPSCWKNRRRGDDPDWYCADGERRTDDDTYRMLEEIGRMKMTRMDRVFQGIECCSAAVRCDQCPYNKYDRKECMKELILDVCNEIGMEVPEDWKDKDY